MPAPRDAELTLSPASSSAFRALSATAAAYSVLSMQTTLMPEWAVNNRSGAPVLALTLPNWVHYRIHMDMNEAVAKALSAERTIAGLTVRKLAATAGIPERSLMRILQAERDIKVNQVELLAQALRLYPHEIIEHAEVILERANRATPDISNITPLNVGGSGDIDLATVPLHNTPLAASTDNTPIDPTRGEG